MGRKPSKDRKESMGVYILSDVKAAIKERGVELSQKESYVASQILEQWFNSGKPPINELDAALQMVRKAKANGKKVEDLVIK